MSLIRQLTKQNYVTDNVTIKNKLYSNVTRQVAEQNHVSYANVIQVY